MIIIITQHSSSINKARQKVLITLKVIESLSYNCADAKMLEQLDHTLKEVETKLRATLPHHDGMLLRPAMITNAAKKVSLKYKKMRLSKYSSLPSQAKGHVGKRDWRFKNRVGSRYMPYAFHTLLGPILADFRTLEYSNFLGNKGVQITKVQS